MPPEPIFDRLCLIGVGLIGSSIARAAKEKGGIARTIVAHTRREATLARVRELGFADVVEPDAAKAVEGCDGVILCVPVGAYAGVMRTIAPHLAPGCVLSDVGSTKGSVIRDLSPLLPPGIHLIPAHPMAGTEHSGPDAGFATLFEGRYCILTPLSGSDRAAAEKVAELWRRCGSMVERMDAETHDKVVAIVSHLPHLIAFTICGTADDLAEETREAVLKFAASGFRDFTRIAASDVDMWRDIFLNNRDALLEMLARFTEDSHALARAVRWGQAEFIEDRIRRGRRIRRGLIERKQA
ncbi:prephenate/arogenate dehydrogenase family protein [Siccirubricoccus sp. KC 17139]|uniref:Prephenate/arogenate dehydrogenase family protein n=1 Tax=Siccirubricoccus soli TaxID=2899147 RepID=A0ABT1D982_9PROT|nr:prephenate/arogenate dehydrogenase family protein [Siccirubricoccus soli]MCO6417749.1 prephenate/arogenate dehydrogenase family protein [Siccirubricoccus soli]MCP2683884.1 prephenate/arogenate dehydrogenase family protein [Siccirubricoccus soli]